jgi:hypothetical protein
VLEPKGPWGKKTPPGGFPERLEPNCITDFFLNVVKLILYNNIIILHRNSICNMTMLI